MIKGAQKRIVVVKNTDSRLFSEAHFILKDGYETGSSTDLLSEVKRIISECIREDGGKKASGRGSCRTDSAGSKPSSPLRVLFGFLIFFLGAAVGCGSAVLLLI